MKDSRRFSFGAYVLSTRNFHFDLFALNRKTACCNENIITTYPQLRCMTNSWKLWNIFISSYSFDDFKYLILMSCCVIYFHLKKSQPCSDCHFQQHYKCFYLRRSFEYRYAIFQLALLCSFSKLLFLLSQLWKKIEKKLIIFKIKMLQQREILLRKHLYHNNEAVCK